MNDLTFMQMAIQLAKGGLGYTTPNPLVGAVLVKEGAVIGQGYHQYFGGPHAEINALSQVTIDPEGATLFVNLEPCSHHGKTPPCVEAIIAHKIKRVVVAMEDPNPMVSGRGIARLRAEGIEVTLGVMAEEAKKLNEIFIHYITTGLPFCLLKTAMSLDGKIATVAGESKWISNASSRHVTHHLRRQFSAILVGIGTILTDDPALTTRLDDHINADPHRIIVDTTCRIPLSARVLSVGSSAKTIIATTHLADVKKVEALKLMGADVIQLPHTTEGVDLKALMAYLGQIAIDSVLIEGGSQLNFSALKDGIVDKICAFIAPMIIGGSSAKTPVGGHGFQNLSDSTRLSDMTLSLLDGDLRIDAYIRKDTPCLLDS